MARPLFATYHKDLAISFYPLTLHMFFLQNLSALCLFFCGLAVAPVASQLRPISWSATPFSPPAYPLAVRSPYLNTWLPQGFGPTQFNVHTWPNHWNIDNTVVGWYASAVVDGKAYRIIGVAPIDGVSIANQTATEFTSTQTTVVLTAGPMQITVSFISPIEPTDLLRQSLPFAYMSISASSTDGAAHSLKLYSDISGEFITGDTSAVAEWAAEDTNDYVVLSMRLQQPAPFAEVHQFAQDGTAYYGLKKKSGTTTSWAIGEDTVVRGTAANQTSLGNDADPVFRAVSTFGNNQPVLGIEVDLGHVQSTSQPLVWAVGVVRSPAIQYKTSSGVIEQRYPYFLSTYDDAITAAKAFLDDFTRAWSASISFDDAISKASQEISSNYTDLLSLTARQTMGCMDITLSKTSNGGWNMSDVKIFMKNMGGAGSDSPGLSMTVNTVDVLYSAFPAFIYLNPALGKYLLTPLLEYQDSPMYTLDYAARNIGSAYPNATADGLDEGHEYGVEETANMLIMMLAYSQASNDTTLLQRYYSLLRRWGDYLLNNSLILTNQKSSDFSPFSDIPNPNQTNLAVKGIIGIGAMSRISEMTNRSDDRDIFKNATAAFISEWQSQALPPDLSHVNFFGGLYESSGLVYNVYADKLLSLGLIPDSVYKILTRSYESDQNRFGLPLSSAQTHNTSMNWMMFAASAASDNATRNAIVSKVHDSVVLVKTFYPMIINYDPSTADFIDANGNGANSPAQGAMFALLVSTAAGAARNGTDSGGTLPPGGGEHPSKRKNRLPIILGGVFGAAAASGIGVAIFFWRRKTKQTRHGESRIDPLVSLEAAGPLSSTVFTSFQRTLTSGYWSTTARSTPLVPGQSTAPNKSDPSHTTPTQTQSSSTASQSTNNALRGATIDRQISGQFQRQDDLREEVQNLRREIERIRELSEDREDMPPSYSERS